MKVIPWEGAWTIRKNCTNAMHMETNCIVMHATKETVQSVYTPQRKTSSTLCREERRNQHCTFPQIQDIVIHFHLKPSLLIWKDNFVLMLTRKGRGVDFCVPIMFWSVRLQRFGAWIFPLVWHWWLLGVLEPQMFGPGIDVQYVQLLRQMVSSKIFHKLLEIYHPGAQRGR